MILLLLLAAFGLVDDAWLAELRAKVRTLPARCAKRADPGACACERACTLRFAPPPNGELRVDWQILRFDLGSDGSMRACAWRTMQHQPWNPMTCTR